MKKTLLVVMLAVLLLACAACGSAEDSGKGAVIGSVNGVDIYQTEYDDCLSDYYDYYYSYYSNYYGMDLSDEETVTAYMPTFISDLENYSWQRCVEMELMMQLAEQEYGITYDNEYIKNFLPYATYKSMASTGVYSQLCESAEVQAAAQSTAEENYNANPQEYRGTSHILITCDDVTDEAQLAQAYAQAMDLIAQLNAGADFDELASANTADSSVSYGPISGDGAMIDGSGNMVTEYSDAAFSLSAVGDFTQEPVLSDYGYHIIRLDSILSSFDEISSYLVNVETYITDMLAQYEENGDIVCNLEFKYYGKEVAEPADDADTEEAAEEETGSAQ